ncbi:MAG: S-layer homology domain-containing protein [Desulfatibacillaceae bacterium]|nr:S-layer homology domain-containing protein [Desulfatibacillaceae bacterium]
MGWRKSSAFVMIAVFALLVFAACSGPKIPRAQLHTPDHHVANGHKLLSKGRVDDARREFEMAIDLEHRYAPAYAGLALAAGATGRFDEAEENLEKAGRYATGPGQEVEVAVAHIRLYTMGKKAFAENWLARSQAWFAKASQEGLADPALLYYMGMAHKAAHELDRAKGLFAQVMSAKGRYTAEADHQYSQIQKIERSQPKTEAARNIALFEEISRAQTAVLFLDELNLAALLDEQAAQRFETLYGQPDSARQLRSPARAQTASDIAGHQHEAQIRQILALDIRGLRPFPDGTFQPDKPITRADYALIMEDLLIMLTDDQTLGTRFVASVSPFPDVRSDFSYFNAIMICTSRNLMTPKDLATNEFDPLGPMSGADALLGIRNLESLLKRK